MLDLTKVHSSNVLAIGFENNILEVWFVDGAVYHYFGVPEHIYNSFLSAPSKGQFVHTHLTNFYHYERLR